MTEASPISEFYKDQDVFVTGATGFVGKVLVEKLLRSCSGVRTIYILLRSKKGQHVKERLQELKSSTIFDRLRDEQPNSLSKIVALQGDLEVSDFGLSFQDRELLFSNVSIVFHSAANVKFDDHLRTAVKQNLLGTKHIINLCKKMQHLKAFIHVSTAYCNCDREEIEEIIYPPPMPPEYVLDTINCMDEDLVTMITPKLLKGRPNTYTFTKALAESLIYQECADIPVAIVRPSIVLATWREPYPGWVDNINGPTGMYLAAGKGILRTMIIEKTKTADYIPVDVVANLMIAVAWYTATEKQNGLPIFNCTSGGINKLTWGDMERITVPILVENPSTDVLRYPSYNSNSSRFFYTLKVMVQHYIPACAIDILCMVSGRRPRMVKLYNRIHRAIEVLHPFTTNEWKFHCNNMFCLMEHMTPFDRQTFNFDISTLKWSLYTENYVLGIRQFLMREDVSTLPVARKSLKKLYLRAQILNLVTIIAFAYVLMKKSSTFRWMVLFIVNLAMKFYRSLPFSIMS